MSLDRCFTGLELDGKIDPPRSAEARALYDELKAFYGRSHSAEEAAVLASHETVRRLEAAAAHKKRNMIRQAQAQAGAIRRIRQYQGADPAGPLDPRGATALFDRDAKAGHNNNVDARRLAIKGRVHGMMDELLYNFRTTITGRLRNRAELEDVVRELFKRGSTGSESARELAEAWSRGAEYLRSRFNEAGGQIGKLEDWGLPHSHDSRAVRMAGYTKWKAAIVDKLDRARMIDSRTGQPFTDEAFEIALRDAGDGHLMRCVLPADGSGRDPEAWTRQSEASS